MANAIAVLGGGCFWCVEAVFQNLRGVSGVKSGYAGGALQNPSYRAVCTGTTGHAEVARITYDPAQMSFADLLRVFFTIHDPTTRDRQGNDVGSQYRSVIFYNDQAEHDTALAVMDEIAKAGIYDHPLVTELSPMPAFWPAEDEHDDYFVNNPFSGYCQVVVAPKVKKFRKMFAERLKAEAA